MKRTTLYIIALSSLALAGCQKNGFDTVYAGGDSIVRFAPSVASTESSTKGTLINEDGSDGAFNASRSFFVSAWNDATTPANIIPGTTGSYQEVKMKGSQWNTVYTNGGKEYCKEYLWKSGEVKTFYAYANLPESEASVSNTVATGQTLTYTVPATADAQTDILMGFYSGDGKTGSPATMTGTASIVFSHPLTAVKFKLGTITGVKPESIEFSSISIENVYASGTAEMTPASAALSDPADRFNWVPAGTTTVSQAIGTQPTTSAPAIGEAFLLIPQTFASNSAARIVIDCSINGVSTTLFYPLAGISWQAGKVIDYHLEYANGSLIFAESEVNDWNEKLVDI